MPEINTRVLVIGAVPAGYTAALYAARANLQPFLVSRTPDTGSRRAKSSNKQV